MDTREPCEPCPSANCRTCDRVATHEAVVLAADGFSAAGRTAANAHDADRRAVEAEQDIGVLDNDADRLEKTRACG